LRTRVILERLTGVFTTRRYTNSRLPYLTLPVSRSFVKGVLFSRQTAFVSVFNCHYIRSVTIQPAWHHSP